ncbi:MAG: DUF3592 domain-containing protein [Acidobacteriota bacterium]
MALDRLVALQRTFEAPRGLTIARPRQTRLTAAGVALAVGAGLFLVGAVVAGLALSREARRRDAVNLAFAQTGTTVEGAVARLWSNGDDRRRVGYRFAINGQTYTGSARVSSERRRHLSVGVPLVVRYVPADPRLNDLGGTRTGASRIAPFLVAIGLAVVGGLFVVPIGRQKRLLEEGRAGPAIVTGHSTHRTPHGGTDRTMTYEFRTLSGAVRTGKSSTSSKPPAIGAVICVLYDPELPQRHAVYPLSLVAVER